MFIILLKFSDNKSQAGQHMDGHNAWLQQGFSDEVFLLAGSIKPQAGGAIIAFNTTLDDLQSRINTDPFVTNGVVSAEITEISPAKTDARLNFIND